MSQGLSFSTAEGAVGEIQRIYKHQTDRLVETYQAFLDGQTPAGHVHAYYPEVTIKIDEYPELKDRSQAYGFAVEPGTYSSTVTRPDIMSAYYKDQFERLIKNHGVNIEVGLSGIPIPLAFALNETRKIKIPETVNQQDMEDPDGIIRRHFDLPDQDNYISTPNGIDWDDPQFPLFWYNGPFTDRSLQRLLHYTGTSPEHFQKYILFTNYADYIEEFRRVAEGEMNQDKERENPYLAFVEPGNRVTLNENIPHAREHFNLVRGQKPAREPQMPAYHLVRQNGMGISIVNIGVGPSNAKTITDELAVLRPHAWMMVGHCAGLAYTQRVGDYVLPNGYVLEDGLMEKEIGQDVDLPELSEIHRATTDAVRTILGVEGRQYKESVRTGIITTTADRNWEAPRSKQVLGELRAKFARNRSMALDMESATIAANGFRHHVPYGALLCVSDKPLHGVPKLPGQALNFYRGRVRQQFDIVMQAMDNIRAMGDQVHSRKMRSDFEYVPTR